MGRHVHNDNGSYVSGRASDSLGLYVVSDTEALIQVMQSTEALSCSFPDASAAFVASSCNKFHRKVQESPPVVASARQ